VWWRLTSGRFPSYDWITVEKYVPESKLAALKNLEHRIPNITCLRYNNGCQFRDIDILMPGVRICCKSKHRKLAFTKVVTTIRWIRTATFLLFCVHLFGTCLFVPHAHNQLSDVTGKKEERPAVSRSSDYKSQQIRVLTLLKMYSMSLSRVH
jgi:hypothetical protein